MLPFAHPARHNPVILNSVPHVSAPTGPEFRRREPAFNIPPVTGGLIVANLLVHVVRQLLSGDTDDNLVERFGFAPERLFHHPDALGFLSLISYQFLHGGWEHLLVNMLALLAFGPGIERPLGPWRYLLAYLGGGIAAALAQAAFTADDPDVLLIGASGGISAVFGTLLIVRSLYGRRRGRFGFLPMALVWIAAMTVTGVAGIGSDGMPVAWIAHIGGFVAGIGFGLLFRSGLRVR
jgi:membrane associated rhomboid family serine protease